MNTIDDRLELSLYAKTSRAVANFLFKVSCTNDVPKQVDLIPKAFYTSLAEYLTHTETRQHRYNSIKV